MWISPNISPLPENVNVKDRDKDEKCKEIKAVRENLKDVGNGQ